MILALFSTFSQLRKYKLEASYVCACSSEQHDKSRGGKEFMKYIMTHMRNVAVCFRL